MSEDRQFQNVLDTERLQFKGSLMRQVFWQLRKLNLTVAIAESVPSATVIRHFSGMPNSEDVVKGAMLCIGTLSLLRLGKVPVSVIKENNTEKIALCLASEIKRICDANIGIATAGTLVESSPGVYSGQLTVAYVLGEFESAKTVEVSATQAILEEKIAQTTFAYLKQHLSSRYNTEEVEERVSLTK